MESVKLTKIEQIDAMAQKGDIRVQKRTKSMYVSKAPAPAPRRMTFKHKETNNEEESATVAPTQRNIQTKCRESLEESVKQKTFELERMRDDEETASSRWRECYNKDGREVVSNCRKVTEDVVHLGRSTFFLNADSEEDNVAEDFKPLSWQFKNVQKDNDRPCGFVDSDDSEDDIVPYPKRNNARPIGEDDVEEYDDIVVYSNYKDELSTNRNVAKGNNARRNYSVDSDDDVEEYDDILYVNYPYADETNVMVAKEDNPKPSCSADSDDVKYYNYTGFTKGEIAWKLEEQTKREPRVVSGYDTTKSSTMRNARSMVFENTDSVARNGTVLSRFDTFKSLRNLPSTSNVKTSESISVDAPKVSETADKTGSQRREKKDTLHNIIDEIKHTNFYNAAVHYLPGFCQDIVELDDPLSVTRDLMIDIQIEELKFSSDLKKAKTLEDVLLAFISNKKLFELYSEYIEQLPSLKLIVKELEPHIKHILKKDSKDFKRLISHQLIAPIQDLARYRLLLEQVVKELKKRNERVGVAVTALNMISHTLRKGNDTLARHTITKNPLKINDYGFYIMRDNFTCLKPKKMDLVVFLFERVIVFTLANKTNVAEFTYWDSIMTDDLRMQRSDESLKLLDYANSNKKVEKRFVLQPKEHTNLQVWKRELEKILWKQFDQLRDDQTLNRRMPSSFNSNSLLNCPFDVTGYGNFITKSEFKTTDTKMTVMVFLFEEIILVTKQQGDSYYYVDSMRMDRSNLAPIGKKRTTLQLVDYRSGRDHGRNVVINLEASSEKIATRWRFIIGQSIWKQVRQAIDRSRQAWDVD